MILIGMFDSPFVRRVAVSMRCSMLPFEHRNWSVGRDFELIRQFNPLGRVPALVLPDGESLIDSTAILDFLDDTVGPERALLPRTGNERRDALADHLARPRRGGQGMHQLLELVFKPPAKRTIPGSSAAAVRCMARWPRSIGSPRCRPGEWMVGGRMTQADITATCVFTFLCDALS